MPLSILGTFAVMWLLGYSLNNLSLMALTIATGFVVDDAIVVTENIARYVEEGMRPFQAALRGAREIGFTIVSITVSLLAVFIPILLMSGIVGRLFREFAVTLAVAITVSGAGLAHRHPDDGLTASCQPPGERPRGRLYRSASARSTRLSSGLRPQRSGRCCPTSG